MTSRAQILKAITANKPPLKPLPVLPAVATDIETFVKVQKFITLLESIGGTTEIADDAGAVSRYHNTLIESGARVVSLAPEAGNGNFVVHSAQTAVELEAVEYAFINASWGVAENGSVWLYESRFANRLLPFICQHLVIILDQKNIVSDMHEAYRLIDVAKEGYGLFLAGPSKTADIEQSLVIGAHGARSAKVFITSK